MDDAAVVLPSERPGFAGLFFPATLLEVLDEGAQGLGADVMLDPLGIGFCDEPGHA